MKNKPINLAGAEVSIIVPETSAKRLMELFDANHSDELMRKAWYKEVIQILRKARWVSKEAPRD